MKGSHYVKPTARFPYLHVFVPVSKWLRERGKQKLQNKNKDPKESLFACPYN